MIAINAASSITKNYGFGITFIVKRSATNADTLITNFILPVFTWRFECGLTVTALNFALQSIIIYLLKSGECITPLA
jgi:hypothetical protein